jgi:hypothetical protein
VVRAGVAAASLSALTGLVILGGAAFLPAGQAAWLVKPLIGIDMGPLEPGYLGFGTGNLAVSIACGAIGIVAAAFYLDHCVIHQPTWAVIGGWGLLLSGILTLTLQEIVSPGRTMFIDIEHLLWPVGLAPVVIGGTLILVSWWRAPELFSPHESRWTLAVVVAALAIGEGVATQVSLSPTTRLAFWAVVVSVAVIAGSWVSERRQISPSPPAAAGLT